MSPEKMINLQELFNIDMKDPMLRNWESMVDLSLKNGKLFLKDKIVETPFRLQTKSIIEKIIDTPYPNAFRITKEAISLITALSAHPSISFISEKLNISEVEFMELVYTFWFQNYPSTAKNSEGLFINSGFKHVFVGNLCDENNGRISGLHHWYSYFIREQRDEIVTSSANLQNNILRVIFYDKKYPNRQKMSTMLFPQSIESAIVAYATALYSVGPFNKGNIRNKMYIVSEYGRTSFDYHIAAASGHIMTAFVSAFK